MEKSFKKELEAFQEPIMNVVAKTQRRVRAEKIICFGYQVVDMMKWSFMAPQHEIERQITCNILYVTGHSERRRAKDYIAMLEECKAPGIGVTWLVHNIYAVQTALKAGDKFYAAVIRDGVLLYDDDLAGLLLPGETVPLGVGENSKWNACLQLGGDFLSVAKVAIETEKFGLAAFHLHQAFEQFAVGVVHAFMGYTAITHSVDRLLNLLDMIGPEFRSVFPGNTKEEEKLLKVLSSAYSDVRYMSDYTVGRRIVSILLERVAMFETIAVALYDERFESGQTQIAKA